jgi:hypothetical protein
MYEESTVNPTKHCLKRGEKMRQLRGHKLVQSAACAAMKIAK